MTIKNDRAKSAAERCEQIDDALIADIHDRAPLDKFAAEPTASNAVALAISDHRAGKLTDWPFVDQLRKAQTMVDAYPKLVEEVRALRALVFDYQDGKASNLIEMPRFKQSAVLLRELGEDV